MESSTIESISYGEDLVVHYPPHLAPPEDGANDEWLVKVQEHWLEEQTQWEENLQKVCPQGDNPKGRHLLEEIRDHVSRLDNKFLFTPPHEDAYRLWRHKFDLKAAGRAAILAFPLWFVYSVFLFCNFQGNIGLLAGFVVSGFAVIGSVYFLSKQGRGDRAEFQTTLRCVALALLIWLLPNVDPAIALEKGTLSCFIFLLFYMVCVADIGRRYTLGLSSFLLLLIVLDPMFTNGRPVPFSGSPSAYVFEILLFLISAFAAFLVAYRRAKSRRIVFSLECRKDALLAYSHSTVAGCTLPQPDFEAFFEAITA
jgi:hypothetical protein